MYKKHLLACLLLVLILSSATAAFATQQPTAFDYRSGVTFGMSVDQVRALESNTGTIKNPFNSSDTRTALIYEKEKVLSLACQITYLFGANGLEEIRVNIAFNTMDYTVYDKLKADFADIDVALANKYGPADQVGYLMETSWNATPGVRDFSIKHAYVVGYALYGSHQIVYKQAVQSEGGQNDGGL